MQAAAPAPSAAAPALSCPSVQLEQGNVPWGLDRINQRALPLDSVYSWTTTGQGINVYVISTVGARIALHISLCSEACRPISQAAMSGPQSGC